MSEEDYPRREALRAEQEQIEAQYAEAEELPDDVDRHFGEIEAELEAFENRPLLYDPDDKAHAGVFISLANDGRLRVERGFVQREDEMPEGPDEIEAGELERLERHVAISNETLALFVRFWLTHTPPLPDTAQAASQAKGRERYEGFIETVGRRLARGKTLADEITRDSDTSVQDGAD